MENDQPPSFDPRNIPAATRRRGIRAPLPPGAVPLGDRPNHNKRYRWKPEMAELLGKVTDVELAKKTGLKSDAVAAERARRGIPPCVEKVAAAVWNPEREARLGKDKDTVIARELGLRPGQVGFRRRVLGIPPYRPSGRRGIDWLARVLERLGKESDDAVGREFGISQNSVAVKRRSLKIPPFREPFERIRWTAEKDAILEGNTDIRAAEILKIAVRSAMLRRLQIGKRRDAVSRTWTEDEKALLGRFSDSEVSRRLPGVSKCMAQSMRRSLGIPPVEGHRPVEWTDEHEKLLGTMFDIELAERVGCSEAVVQKRREARGIPPFARQRKSMFWTPEKDALLGTASDPKIAARLGVRWGIVADRRIALGIASYRRSSAALVWDMKNDPLLGIAPDEEIARQLNLPAGRVTARRCHLGIAKFRQSPPDPARPSGASP